MIQRNKIKNILKQYWGYETFRDKQEEIICAVLGGKDTLALLTTGGGKSLCFQVPSMEKEGICLVVSPLIALMQDQVLSLQKRGIKAIAITSGMSKREIDIGLDNAVYGNYKFLYVSPERLETIIFKERLKKMKVNLVAVDEAHCISQWGYDFRPAYLNIAKLRETLIDVPFLALTATATKKVIVDIQEKLAFRKPNVIKTSFKREKLAYVVLKEEDKESKAIKVINGVKGSGIVYVKTRNKTKEVANVLLANDISAKYYHAGLAYEDRKQVQEDWINNKFRVIVATNAFGMGIDKSNVRFVIHIDVPQSIEAYFQEAGRGGRDGKKAYAVALWNKSNKESYIKEIELKYPAIEKIRKTYLALGNHFQVPIGGGEGQSFSFDIEAFASKYHFGIKETFHGMGLLVKEGLLLLSDDFYKPSTVYIKQNLKNLYKIQVQNKLYDVLIKNLLRTYGGLFEGFVKINENDLAKNSNLTKAKVVSLLKRLKEVDVIDYEAQSSFPQLTYLRPRIEAERVQLSKENYSDRKKMEAEKWKAVTLYFENDNICRSSQILQYFEEKDAKDCGVCDVCLDKKRKKKTRKEKEKMQEIIIEELKGNKLTTKQIVAKTKGLKEEEVLKELSYLADNKNILTDGTLFWLV